MEQTNNQENISSQDVFIDNKKVTQEDFEKAKENPSTRLYQEDSNHFRTLSKLKG